VKCGARVALGVAGGYFLGRTKKMKLAMMLAGMAAGRRAGGPAGLLSQGAKLLGQSPELLRLNDELKGRLLEAGKSAALAVAARQVESLTDRLSDRVGSLADVPSGRSRKDQEPDEYPSDDVDDAPEASAADDADDVEDAEDGEEAPEPPRRRGRARPAATAAGAGTAALKRAGGAAGGTARAAGKAVAGRRGGRPARARQGEGDG
jgi:hypothetical protein